MSESNITFVTVSGNEKIASCFFKQKTTTTNELEFMGIPKICASLKKKKIKMTIKVISKHFIL